MVDWIFRLIKEHMKETRDRSYRSSDNHSNPRSRFYFFNSTVYVSQFFHDKSFHNLCFVDYFYSELIRDNKWSLKSYFNYIIEASMNWSQEMNPSNLFLNSFDNFCQVVPSFCLINSSVNNGGIYWNGSWGYPRVN